MLQRTGPASCASISTGPAATHATSATIPAPARTRTETAWAAASKKRATSSTARSRRTVCTMISGVSSGDLGTSLPQGRHCRSAVQSTTMTRTRTTAKTTTVMPQNMTSLLTWRVMARSRVRGRGRHPREMHPQEKMPPRAPLQTTLLVVVATTTIVRDGGTTTTATVAGGIAARARGAAMRRGGPETDLGTAGAGAEALVPMLMGATVSGRLHRPVAVATGTARGQDRRRGTAGSTDRGARSNRFYYQCTYQIV
mmetsp:Transcript_8091/g.23867  ORF Transcript_8091/g.23867 Transcript_8091/m.23867 type:complete len:255 (+) Transcript_8091:314-1078(+)